MPAPAAATGSSISHAFEQPDPHLRDSSQRAVEPVSRGHPRRGAVRDAAPQALRVADRRPRPVLLIDEAQEMSPLLLGELRLLGSTRLDTCTIVTVVLCGDRRLEDKLRTPDLLPVASRIRTRLVLDAEPPDVLGTMLRHLLATAGNASLMTDELQRTVCEHAAGNRRVLMNLCNELLLLAVAKKAKQLDESLYLDLTSADHRPARATAAPARTKPARR
jgi:general secretion pathway protein A